MPPVTLDVLIVDATMDNPNYNPESEYDDYDLYPESGLTSVGLPTSQLALIIGVNAVISLIISVVVVLIANRQVVPGDIATPDGQSNVVATPGQVVSGSDIQAEPTDLLQAPDSTPIQSLNYVVQAGDTLGVIADRFSVSLFDLMTVNGLTNQDFIQVGQELVIPVGGLSTPTATFTPVPIPSETPLPFDPPTPLPEDASIPPEPATTVGPSPTPTDTPPVTPTQSDATPTVLPTSTPASFDELNVLVDEVRDPGDFLLETVVILNQGAGVSLNGWKLEGSTLANFVLPDIFLFSGGSIRVHTTAGQNTPSDLYLGQGEAAWPPGTTVILKDSNDTEISSFTIPGP